MAELITFAGYTVGGMAMTFLVMTEVASEAMRKRDKLPLLVFVVVLVWILAAVLAGILAQWLVVVSTILMIAAGVGGWLVARSFDRPSASSAT